MRPGVGATTKAMSLGRAISTLLIALAAVGCGAEGMTRRLQQCVECSVKRNNPVEARNAVKRFMAQCRSGDAASCSAAGVFHEHGRGVAADVRTAVAFYRRACTAGNQFGCVNLGRLCEAGAIGRVDREAAELIYQFACEGGAGEACYHLARLRRGRNDDKGAVGALRKGCEAGNAEACEGLGIMYQHGQGVVPDSQRARSLFTQACRIGSDGACMRM
jgi:TPR repeat protein